MNDGIKKALEIIRSSGYRIKIKRMAPKGVRLGRLTRSKIANILGGGEICVLTPPDQKGRVLAWSMTSYKNKTGSAAKARGIRAAKAALTGSGS